MSQDGAGLEAISEDGAGLEAISEDGAGLEAISEDGAGLEAISEDGAGLEAISEDGAGLEAISEDGAGLGISTQGFCGNHHQRTLSLFDVRPMPYHIATLSYLLNTAANTIEPTTKESRDTDHAPFKLSLLNLGGTIR